MYQRSVSLFLSFLIGGTVYHVSPSVVQAVAQEPVPAHISANPPTLTLALGAKAQLTVSVHDAGGGIIDVPVRLISPSPRAVSITPEGQVTGLRAGSFHVTAVVVLPGMEAPGVPLGIPGRPDPYRRALTLDIPVTVMPAAIATVEILGAGERFYSGVTLRHRARVTDATGEERSLEPVRWSTSNPAVAAVDRFGQMTALKPGMVTLIAEAGEIKAEHVYRVVPDPIATLQLTASAERVRTGDVVQFAATALDREAHPVTDVPVTFSVAAVLADTVIAPAPPAQVDDRGRFVADRAGDYTVFAVVGQHVAKRTVTVTNREVGRNIRVMGRGSVTEVHTSDLWVWEAQDGRDYAITGTWNAGGWAYTWDVSDPANLFKVDSVQVDARTVNDVKVSEDGRIAVISREGASNRRNGLVILDVTDPRDIEIIGTFDDGLTGGVHNIFIYQNHVYATNNGRRYDIINIEDPTRPRRVAVFELDTPGHGIHDVWVHDGIAYSSQWLDGVILVDVGNGIAGGRPDRPVQFAQYKYPSAGGTHTSLPWQSPTGKFYVLAGDGMIWPSGLSPEEPSEPGGHIHFIDFTDPKNPKEVARYEVPEAGPHNYWIEDEVLYIAHYNAGLRVVDISGDLMGNLYTQGREMAKFKPFDRNGVVPNAPMTWGVMPWKGNIFFTDMNSGLWAIRAEPKQVLIQ